jgi:hypothetical protein
MASYRLYLLSSRNTILAREDFNAADDAVAHAIAAAVARAWSDRCSGHMLWQGERRVDNPQRDGTSVPLGAEAWETVRALETSLREDGWRIAGSDEPLTAEEQQDRDAAA